MKVGNDMLLKSIKNPILGLFILLLCVNTTCSDDDNAPVQSDCDFITQIDEQAYNDLDNEVHFIISEALISEDCLVLSISSSGCDASTWEYELIDSGNVAESSPVQRYLKLKFTNQEACLAVFIREVTFDISNLQVEGEDAVNFNIEGWSDILSYTY